MSKKCPIGFANGYHCCDSDCVLYQDGCLIAQALNVYINTNIPITIYDPKDDFEEIKELLESTPDTIQPMIAP